MPDESEPQFEIPQAAPAEPETPEQYQERRERNTELWSKCVIQALLLINASHSIGIDVDDNLSVALVAGIEAVYTISRTIKKRGASNAAVAAHTAVTKQAQTDRFVASLAAALSATLTRQQQIHAERTPAPTAPAVSPVTVNVDTKPQTGEPKS